MWIENAQRVMPKGKLLPMPLLCTLTFGAPIMLARRTRSATPSSPARATRCWRLRPPEE